VHRSVMVLILVSFGALVFHMGTVCSRSETGAAVVDMGNVDAPSKWTAGTPRW